MITHNTARHRFELTRDGLTAYVEYLPTPDGMNLIHTIVPAALEGQGIGSSLARYALDYARAENRKVVPSCSFIRRFIGKHPEYADLTE